MTISVAFAASASQISSQKPIDARVFVNGRGPKPGFGRDEAERKVFDRYLRALEAKAQKKPPGSDF